MSVKKYTAVLSIVLIAFVVSSCTTARVESWTDPAFKSRPIGDVLVMGVTAQTSARRRFEDIFVKGLAEVGVTAVASYSLLPQEAQLTKDEITKALKSSSANSLIVTKISGEKDKIEVVQPMVYQAPYDFYRRSYSPIMAQGYVQNYTEIYLEMNLYDAATQKLVWSGRTKVTSEKSNDDNMKLVINGIIKDLQKQGMLSSEE